jgi:hypothetical protein
MTSRNYFFTVAASAVLLSACGGSAFPANSGTSQAALSSARANAIPLITRTHVTASEPTLSGGVASGTASFSAVLSKGAHEKLVSKLYEGSKVVATARKTVHGPAEPFSVTAMYTCKGTTESSFHTYASGTGLFNQTATSETVTLACN